MSREIAVIVGVGPGLGWALVKRFAREGFATVACARDPKKIEPLARAEGVEARLEACDAAKAGDVARVFAAVERDLGVPGVVVFNAGAYERGGILEITPESFEHCWRVGCLGGLL